MGQLLAKRALTTRFHIEVHYDTTTEPIDGALVGTYSIHVVKTSNGQSIPLDEPLFLLRARDMLAAPLLLCYRALIQAASYPDAKAKDEHLQSNHDAIRTFEAFAQTHSERMKLPNITRGK